MGRTELKLETVHRILAASFDNPFSFPSLVDREVTRNRSLRSSDRRELTDLLHDCMRWRRRIWGDIAPTKIDDRFLMERLVEAKALRQAPPLSRWAGMQVEAVAREVSFPTWIFERWVHQFGLADAAHIALSMNEPAPTTLRANALKIQRAKLREKLSREDVPTDETALSPWGLHVKGRRNLRALPAFKQGLFDVQDEGSQVAALSTGARPGDLAVDACAGAGGKTLAMAAMMENQGKIVASDADSRVFPELLRRARRAGAKGIETAWVAPEDPEPLSHLREKADVVVVDAPCSALGVVRRRPWTKFSISPETADVFPAKQLSLLKKFARLVRPEGRLVYVTCTLSQRENEDVVSRFLSEAGGFRNADPPRLLRPDTDGTDGFFIATMTR